MDKIKNLMLWTVILILIYMHYKVIRLFAENKEPEFKTEYRVELRGDSAIIKNNYSETFICPIDSIPNVLIKDNQ
jgi:hypothetical protein